MSFAKFSKVQPSFDLVQPSLANSSKVQPGLIKLGQLQASFSQVLAKLSKVYLSLTKFIQLPMFCQVQPMSAMFKRKQLSFVLPLIFLDEIEVQPHKNVAKIAVYLHKNAAKIEVLPHKNLPCSSYFGPKLHLHGKFYAFSIKKL